jgi:hypothetical protein
LLTRVLSVRIGGRDHRFRVTLDADGGGELPGRFSLAWLADGDTRVQAEFAGSVEDVGLAAAAPHVCPVEPALWRRLTPENRLAHVLYEVVYAPLHARDDAEAAIAARLRDAAGSRPLEVDGERDPRPA